MDTKPIEQAIIIINSKITPDIKSDDALRLTQAALNLAHTISTVKATER